MVLECTLGGMQIWCKLSAIVQINLHEVAEMQPGIHSRDSVSNFRTQKPLAFFVEPEGVEPSSKQGTRKLSTRLVVV